MGSGFDAEELEMLRPQPTYPHWLNKQSQIINAAHKKCLERNELREKLNDLQGKYKKDMEEKDAQLKDAQLKIINRYAKKKTSEVLY